MHHNPLISLTKIQSFGVNAIKTFIAMWVQNNATPRSLRHDIGKSHMTRNSQIFHNKFNGLTKLLRYQRSQSIHQIRPELGTSSRSFERLSHHDARCELRQKDK